ncbi:hypothetical protein A2U01_0066989, partial [Trifolium medium]|nr:hypothetical protein [Trifolium medium]
MEAKIATLEEELLGVKTTLAAMEKNQAHLFTLFEKSLGKSVMTGEESVGGKGGSVRVDGEGSRRRSEIQDPFVCRVTRWWSFVTQRRKWSYRCSMAMI